MPPRNNNRLSDIEAPCRAEVVEAERDVFPIGVRRLPASKRAFRHEDLRRDFVRAAQNETFLFEQLGDRAQ